MTDSKSTLVEKSLAKPDLHLQWEKLYRTAENERFVEEVFDYMLHILNPPMDSMFLDAGCGRCAHSVRLANRGFQVRAVDFSESALKMAEVNIRGKGLESRIRLECQNLLALSFEDESFDFILCWGVLMHVPDVEKAISEIARVTRPGGALIIHEANMSSLQSMVVKSLRRLLKREKALVKKTPAGMEYWSSNSAGTLLTRHADIGWLIREFMSHGFVVKKWIGGQFTEAYTRVESNAAKSFIHRFNTFWFRYVRIPHPAFTNILILQKGQ